MILVLLEDDFELIYNRTFTGIFSLSGFNFFFLSRLLYLLMQEGVKIT